MLKLTRTLLSPAPNPWSYSISGLVFVVATLASVFFWNHSLDISANRAQIETSHEYWRLFTTTFVHGDLKHLLSNAFFLWIFGFLLNSYFGFWVFPVLSFVMGAVINALTLVNYPDQVTLLGASGVVYWMAAFWATLYVMIERGVHPLKRVMTVMGVSLILFFPNTYEPQISYSAHAWGFLLGIVSGLIYFRTQRTSIRSHEHWVETHPEPEYDPELARYFRDEIEDAEFWEKEKTDKEHAASSSH